MQHVANIKTETVSKLVKKNFVNMSIFSHNYMLFLRITITLLLYKYILWPTSTTTTFTVLFRSRSCWRWNARETFHILTVLSGVVREGRPLLSNSSFRGLLRVDISREFLLCVIFLLLWTVIFFVIVICEVL